MSATTQPHGLLIAAATALLRSLLGNGLLRHGLTDFLGDVSVSALPPDRIQLGADERSQLNLFLYRATPNTRWRSGHLAAGGNGQSMLALDLHYLLTAYGEHDLHAELLLGYAVQTIHEAPILTGDAIGNLLANGGGSGASEPIRAALGRPDVASRIRQVEIVPEFLGMEDLSKLWSALQARYRPSLAYKVTTTMLNPT